MRTVCKVGLVVQVGLNLALSSKDDAGGADIINISADIAGALKGPKPGAKQKPRAKKPPAPAA